jgi:membrane protein
MSNPLRLAQRTVRSYAAHACGIYAGALAFSGLLALFPLLLLVITLGNIVLRGSNATQLVLARVASFLPGSASIAFAAIEAITTAEPVLLGLGTLGLLWSSLGVFLTLGYALNRVWDLPRDRPLVTQYLFAVALVLSVGGLLVLSLVLSTLVVIPPLLPATLAGLGLPEVDPRVLVFPAVFDLLIVTVAAAILYRVLPNTAVRMRDVWFPALLMALVWEAVKLSFNWYLGGVAHFDRIYGPVAAVAGLMFWMYVSSVLLLLGAELSHQLAVTRTEAG